MTAPARDRYGPGHPLFCLRFAGAGASVSCAPRTRPSGERRRARPGVMEDSKTDTLTFQEISHLNDRKVELKAREDAEAAAGESCK